MATIASVRITNRVADLVEAIRRAGDSIAATHNAINAAAARSVARCNTIRPLLADRPLFGGLAAPRKEV